MTPQCGKISHSSSCQIFSMEVATITRDVTTITRDVTTITKEVSNPIGVVQMGLIQMNPSPNDISRNGGSLNGCGPKITGECSL